MANGVTINLDKERKLKYGINAMVRLEEMLDRPLTSISDTEMGIKELRIMLYVGLYENDKTLTLEKTGDLMDIALEGGGIEYLSNVLGEALSNSMGGATPSE